MISESIDVLIIAETKIENTFPSSQFVIEGFMKPFRYDRNQNGGGLLIYVRERAPIKALTQYKAPNDLECGMIEINLKNKTWLLVAIYRPPLLKRNSISLTRSVKCSITTVGNMKISF